jgi:hypothetical protein
MALLQIGCLDYAVIYITSCGLIVFNTAGWLFVVPQGCCTKCVLKY